MLRGLYDFKATFPKALSFRENDYFVLLQSNTKQRNWWQVINKEGQVGFIPSNYATIEKVNNTNINFLFLNLKNLKSFCGKKDAFDCAGIIYN